MDQEKLPEEKNKKKKGGKKFLIILSAAAVLFAVSLFIPSLGVRCLLNGHRPGSEVIIDKEANCSEEGSGHRVCTVCGRRAVKVRISKRAVHSYENGVCTVCNAEDPSKGNEGQSAVLFRAKTLYDIHVRKGPGTDYDKIRTLSPGSVVEVYETKTAGGYTWNRISENEWIANDGSWLEKLE